MCLRIGLQVPVHVEVALLPLVLNARRDDACGCLAEILRVCAGWHLATLSLELTTLNLL